MAAALVLALLPGSALADAPASGHAGGARVLVWPGDADTPADEAERVLAAAGYRIVPWAPIGARLRAHGEAARTRDAQILGEVERALGNARQAYLDQRFDDMIATLAATEERALDLLAAPPHIPVLWELVFQRGLAHRARGRPGDPEQARERFLLALALEPDRRPLRELYGPDVVAAFADALSVRAASTPRPVPIRVTPADARVLVDGVPLLDDPRAGLRGGLPGPGPAPGLRPGLHVIRATAPGFDPAARLVSVTEQGEIAVALVAREPVDPVDRIGASWARGELRASTGPGLQAVRAVAAAAGAERIVLLEANRATGEVTARLIARDHAGAPVVRGSVAEAVGAALARAEEIAPAGGAPGAPVPERRAGAARRSWTRWWIWAGVGAVAAGAVIVATTLDSGPERVLVFAPSP